MLSPLIRTVSMMGHKICFYGKIWIIIPKLSLLVGWLIDFGFNGPLRQFFSLYRAVSQREGERGKKGQMRVKMSKKNPPAPTASAVDSYCNPNCRTPRYWKFTQHHRTTRLPLNYPCCPLLSGALMLSHQRKYPISQK